MPRSPLRAPNPKIDYSSYLLVFREEFDSEDDPVAGQAEPAVAAFPEQINSVSLFGNEDPLEVEIGSGKGLFLTNQAKAHPGRNFVGIEIVHKYAEHSAARLAKSRCENAKMISGNAERILATRIPSESLDAVHVYFPDPWWKKRHRKRRVVNEVSVKNYYAALRPGGRFHFWTDVLDYFEATIEMIAEVAPQFGVPIPEEERPSTHDLDYQTHFERRSRKNRIPVYRVRYEKRET